jgi:hypothetical protein
VTLDALGGCPTHKHGFTSRAKARKYLMRNVAQLAAKRVYRCSRCGLWHLTSQDRRRAAA